MHVNKVVLFLIMFAAPVLKAQELTLEQAIAMALKNNYDIQIVANDAEIAVNNNTLGNAGMLPRVDINASTSFANNATKQEFSSGLSVDKTGVQSNNVNAGVFLTWTIFDGFRMFAAHERLKELEAMGSLASRIRIETTLAGVITSYYNVVKQEQLIKALHENITISEERLSITQKKLDVGAGSKLDVLQAKVDKNAQTSILLRQRTILSQLKSDLNVLLSRPADVEFEVQDSIPVQFRLDYEELRNTMQKSNTGLMYAERNVSLSRQLLRETKSDMYPRLNFNANYLFARSQNQAGFALLNQNLGLNLGLTASWTIFNGFTVNNRIKNARLEIENAELQYNSVKLQTEQQLLLAFKRFSDDQKILALEEENASLAKEAVDIALERFRIGASNSLELREIQRSYEDALVRLAEARYAAKVTETELMRINGGLIR